MEEEEAKPRGCFVVVVGLTNWRIVRHRFNFICKHQTLFFSENKEVNFTRRFRKCFFFFGGGVSLIFIYSNSHFVVLDRSKKTDFPFLVGKLPRCSKRKRKNLVERSMRLFRSHFFFRVKVTPSSFPSCLPLWRCHHRLPGEQEEGRKEGRRRMPCPYLTRLEERKGGRGGHVGGGTFQK